MHYTCAVLSVADINRSREFYETLFGLEVDRDYGINISFTCGLALQQNLAWLVGIPEAHIVKRPNNMELAFEEVQFDAFLEKLEKYDVERLGNVVEHSWGQRVVRFYDPDGHIIEVGEEMKTVAQRFLDAGMDLPAVSARMGISTRDLTKLLNR